MFFFFLFQQYVRGLNFSGCRRIEGVAIVARSNDVFSYIGKNPIMIVVFGVVYGVRKDLLIVFDAFP